LPPKIIDFATQKFLVFTREKKKGGRGRGRGVLRCGFSIGLPLCLLFFNFFLTKENPLEEESTINQAWKQVQSSKAIQKTTIMAY